eukprot:236304_1
MAKQTAKGAMMIKTIQQHYWSHVLWSTSLRPLTIIRINKRTVIHVIHYPVYPHLPHLRMSSMRIDRPKKTKKRKHARLNGDSPVIMCSALTTDQRTDYEQFKEQFDDVARFVTKWNRNVTHLVTPATIKEDAMLTATTIKYYQSVVAGCWVLCFDWVGQCVANDQLCDETSYQVQEDRTGRDGCRKARELRMNKECNGLFSKVTVFIASAFERTKLDDGLRKLFEIGGAEVMNVSILDLTETHTKELMDKNMVFVYDTMDGLTTAQELVCAKFGILPIGFEEVFDAISNYSRIDKRMSFIQ